MLPLTHRPAPSQRLAVVSFVPVQDAAAHSVVAALLALRHPSTGSHQYCLQTLAPLQPVCVVETGQVPAAQILGDVKVMLFAPPQEPAAHWAVLFAYVHVLFEHDASLQPTAVQSETARQHSPLEQQIPPSQ